MSEVTFIGLVVSLAVLFALVVYTIMYYLRRKRRQILDSMSSDRTEWVDDTAHNQILTTKALIERAQRNGEDVAAAKERLKEAEARLKVGDPEQALVIAKHAREAIPRNTPAKATKQRLPMTNNAEPKEEILYRDIAKGNVAQDIAPVDEEGPTPDSREAAGSEAPPMAEFRKKVPRNYLEARFEVNVLEESLNSAAPDTAAEPRKLLAAAKKSMERQDYTEALRLAMRGRRTLPTKPVETIPLTPGTMVDVPPESPVPSALRSSAPQTVSEVTMDGITGEAKPTTVICPRCHKDNPVTNKFCRGCGKPLSAPVCPRCQKPLSPDDTFCGTCGTPIEAQG